MEALAALGADEVVTGTINADKDEHGNNDSERDPGHFPPWTIIILSADVDLTGR